MMGSWLFEPTSPQADPRWISNDPIRTTYEFLTTCILTLIACVWTALHSNIPLSTRRHASTSLFFDKLQYATIAMLAPELVLYGAFRQLWEARLICNILQKIELERKTEPGLLEDEESKLREGDGQLQPEIIEVVEVIPDSAAAHTEDKSPKVTQQAVTQSEKDTLPSQWRRRYKYFFPDHLERGFFLAMGGIEVVDKANPIARRQLTPRGVITMARAGLLPVVDIDEINDKSKSDGFGRLVVCIQAGWMILQAITRKIKGLPQTLLEIHILTHVICALGMYLFWLKKPQNVLVTTIVKIDAEAISLLIDKPEDFAKGESPNFWSDDESSINNETDQGSLVDQTETGFLDFTRGELIKVPFSILICGAYGAIHLLPWYGHFPTHLERIMWRISGVIVLATPTIVVFFRLALRPFMRPLLHANGVYLLNADDSASLKRRPTMQEMRGSVRSRRWVRLALQVYAYFCMGVVIPVMGLGYVLARFFLIVESFASLRSLPVGTHQSVSWLGMIPHF